MLPSVCRCITPILLFTNTLLTGSSDPQPVGRAYAVVQPPSSRSPVIPEPTKAKQEQVEVLKVGVAPTASFLGFWRAMKRRVLAA